MTAVISTCKIGVLLAAYEGEAWIDKQIESILNQEGVEVSLIVSVDLSRDTTLDIVTQIAAHDPRVQVLPYGDRYGSAGANFFRLMQDVDLTGFDFISFADQDDIWYLDKLARAMTQIRDRSVDAYSSNVIAFWEDGRTKLVHKSDPQTLYDHYFEAAGPGCTYVLTPELGADIQNFLNNSPDIVATFPLHDWLFYCFARSNGYTWFIDDRPGLAYRQHAENIVGFNHGIKSYIRRLQLMKRRWYRNHVSTLLQIFPRPDVPVQGLRMFLLRNFTQLRRRRRDKFVLLAMIVTGMF